MGARSYGDGCAGGVKSFEIVAAVYDSRIGKTTPGAHRDAATKAAVIDRQPQPLKKRLQKSIKHHIVLA